MNLDHDFVQVWKFGEDQKKMQMEHLFSANSGEDQKKSLYQKSNTFFPKFSLRCTPIQIIGGDADVDHSQTIGGIYPPLPILVPAPLLETCHFWLQRGAKTKSRLATSANGSE